MIGKVLDGKYRLVRILGAGGMGSVYEATELDTGRSVAIKLIHAALTVHSDGDAFVTRFDREVRSARAIDTEHIVRILDAGTDPETQGPYMVMEYLQGSDVQQLLERVGAVAPDVALRITAQACLGLAKAHEARVVHRDVKPANLFLAKGAGDAYTVKILDFGVAKMRHELGDSPQTRALTRTGSMLGSPLYMSPEQARNVKHLDHRSDLWSLGVVLYELLADRTPCQDIDGLGELLIELCSHPPAPVQTFAPWTPRDVAALVDRALRVDPAERFQSADEMLAAIEALLPDGHAIHETMLMPIASADRARIAPRFRRENAPVVSDEPSIDLAETVGAPSSALGERVPATTPVAEVAQPQSSRAEEVAEPPSDPQPASPPRRRSPTLVMVAAVLLGAAGAYALSRGASSAPPSVSPQLAETAAVTAPSAPAPVIVVAPAADTALPQTGPTAAPSVAPTAVAPAAPAPVALVPGASVRAAIPAAKSAPVGADKQAPSAATGASSATTTPITTTAAQKDPPRLDHSAFGDRK